MLPDTPDVRDVELGEGGVLQRARPGTVVIDMSTVDPYLAFEIDRAARGRHLCSLDAPVSGGEKGAVEATLAIMVGGEKDVFVGARPILEATGKTISDVGPAGAGQVVKAANHLLVGGNIAPVAEAIKFLEGHQIEIEPALAVLSAGLAGSRVLETKAQTMADRDFQPSFRAELHHKDMGILLREAREPRIPLPLGALVDQLCSALIAQGGGGLDHSALLRAVDSIATTPACQWKIPESIPDVPDPGESGRC